MKSFLFSLSVVLSTSIFSMHHESSESSLMPVAKPGQVIVTYRGSCPEKNIDKAINIVKQTIAYERKKVPSGVGDVSRTHQTAGHGRPWPAMAGQGRPRPAKAGHIGGGSRDHLP